MSINATLQAAVDAAFLTLGVSATYTPLAGGGPYTVQVMPARPDEIENITDFTSVRDETAVFDLRTSESFTPAKGDTLVFDGTTYTVKTAPLRRDSRRHIWTIETYPA